ncbi:MULTISPECIES: hypothetical protein [Aurantimonas]|uniref:hypothetical protein n=1 Tax=Aurantimonas TaxID=182269 RepID=UPI003511195D
MAYSRTSSFSGGRGLSSAPRLGGGVGTDLPPKVPQTPRDISRARDQERRAEFAWKAYDGLKASTNRLLREAYLAGHRDGRAGRPENPPTVDTLRKGRGRVHR